MRSLIGERERAIVLRKQGKTYTEILEEIHIAKSTLSEWLKSVSLAKAQRQRITKKRIAAQKRAVYMIKTRRKETLRKFVESGVKDVGKIAPRDLFILGTSLYWAEGAKQKEIYNVSQRVDFTNSDISIIKVFLKWLTICCLVDDDSREFELYIHESLGKDKINESVSWWREKLHLGQTAVIKVRIKRHKLSTRRHITNYHGQFRVIVLKSTNLNRKIAGWIAGLASNF